VTAAGLDVATQFFGIRSMYMDHAASCIFMDIDAVARHFNSHEAYIMQLVLEPGIDLVQERSLANEVARVVPGARFSSGRGIKEIIGEAGMTILSISSAVAFVALFLSSIAVGNLVAAGITARRFEFGVLRAVGSPNSLLARIVYAEVLVIVILAGMVGIGMGFHLAWMGTTMYQGLAGLELEVIVPYRPLVVGLLIMATLTAIAASWPIFTLLRKPTRDLLALGG
jgi:putative ABC transport system permease protein